MYFHGEGGERILSFLFFLWGRGVRKYLGIIRGSLIKPKHKKFLSLDRHTLFSLFFTRNFEGSIGAFPKKL